MSERPYGETLGDGRLFIGAAERNKQPILEVLQAHFPDTGTVLEIGSGSGQHVVHFATGLPGLQWQPSDPAADFRRSIALRVADAGLTNVAEPLALDVHDVRWPITKVDAMLSINMIHVAPWSATLALFRGAATVLAQRGVLMLYGPFMRDGQHTSDGNRQFDQDLRGHDPAWGLRDMTEIVALARQNGFVHDATVAMPANNVSLVFRRLEK